MSTSETSSSSASQVKMTQIEGDSKVVGDIKVEKETKPAIQTIDKPKEVKKSKPRNLFNHVDFF